MIIAHNVGEGSLKITSTPRNMWKCLENEHRIIGGGQSCNIGRLSPLLVLNSDGRHVNVEATGTDQSSVTYERFQCTWWAFIRRRQIGRPVDPYMGNGAQWNDSAAKLGYPVSRSPRPGDVMCFEAGVHGTDPVYGRVAVVEEVEDDGSIIISQSGTGWMAVVIETISPQQLKAMGDGISFIH
ncbi:CHAP domain-containing protein [Bifidobacterium bohemicum]|uniref:CHAP domain protein n=1 Tax=Bifidobacterium bohemicum DSM 22767 TaxID=1437606 RepID=A0A086ZJW3_9BIFI|nr:CHAP domain-containing protein [Bifidobacterium bohemicum]KFI46813.1 CHAP domain protein [Bifidobacterium bohemicum DSM 22767]SCB82087.1 CHAP domain-containing protein [Bifidobacterium bohemicum]